ncbi:hypothetical protein [Peribacillus simplex]|uniref:Lipoprotein n=1 Tax=Peribacillus simplex TaxID=1478 RepID=A0AAN2PEJ5_9BACI|nr:hypothetical protein [Peribacillus simplex]CEG30035.1 hypothetical protein BN1180_00130 [Peribacillus simplex]
MRAFILCLSLFVIAGCGSENSGVEKVDSSLQSVDDLNKTVWKDSEKAFNTVVKRYEDISTVTDSESNQLDGYFDKYYESGYLDMENAESHLVTSIYALSVQVTLGSVGTEEEQKENFRDIQETYLEVEQMFKEHKDIDN